MVLKKVLFDFTIPALYNAGIRSWSLDFLESLKSTNQYDITIVTPINLNFLNQYGEVIVVPYWRYRIPLLHRFLYYRFRFQANVLSWKGEIVISPYFQLPKAVLKSKKCIVTIHDTLYYDLSNFYRRIDLYLLRLLTNYFHKLNIELAHKVLTVSSFSRERIYALFQKQCYGVFYNIPSVVSRGEPVTTDDKYFVYFGGWERRKRAKIAMRIASEILQSDPSYKFVVSGVQDFSKITSSFNKELRNRIIYKYRFTKDELQYYYLNSSFSLYTSAFEGFGIPLLESQLFGKPVIILEDLQLSDEIPVDGVIVLSEISSESIQEALVRLEAIETGSVLKESNAAIDKLKYRNEKFMKYFYENI